MIWAIKLALAGIGPLIWHWGIGIGLIIICILLEMFAGMIPVFGPFLEKFRKDLIWIAVGIAVALGYSAMLVRDEANRCLAKEAVVQREVKDAVQKAKTQPRLDKWDTEK